MLRANGDTTEAPHPARPAQGRPITVLHLLPDLAVGGGQVIVRNLVSQDVADIRHVVGALADGPLRDSFRASGAPLVVARATRRTGALALLSQVRDVVEWVSTFDVDVIHANNTPLDRSVAQAAGAWCRRPVVNTLMAVASSHRPRRQDEALAPFVRRRAGNLANRVLFRSNIAQVTALSRAVARAHAQALRLPVERIAVVGPGLPDVPHPAAAEVTSTRSALGLDGSYPVLLSVGRLERNKGQNELVEAFEQVAHRQPAAHLLLVGEGEDRDLLIDQISASGLTGRASVLGRRDDVPVLAALSDVFVSTAHHEGFGMAVLEAMAAGCAVVAYTNEAVAIGEFVEDGVSGRLVEERPDRLAEAILDLVGDRAALTRAGEAAAAAAAERTVARSAAAMADIYRRVARCDRRRRGG